MHSDAVLRNLRLLLDILETAPVHGTHKYALVLGLLDSLPTFIDDEDGFVQVSIESIADRIIDLYWHQTERYVTSSGEAVDLSQVNRSAKGPHVYLGVAASLQEEFSGMRLHAIRVDHVAGYKEQRRRVAAALMANPISRFHVGFEKEEPLWKIYGSGATAILVMSAESFEAFASFASTIRDVAQRRFVDKVIALNRLNDERACLEGHLFGEERMVPSTEMREALIEVQQGRCVYTGLPIVRPSVDHFIPWSVVHLSEIENLVMTTVDVNSSKGARLADWKTREKWSSHLRINRGELERLAAEFDWSSDPDRVERAAGSFYRGAAERVLWSPGVSS